MSAAPALRTVARLAISVAAPQSLGQLKGAERRLIAILGGTITGDGFSGSILAGGSDLQMVRADGTIELLARYAVDLGELGQVLIENTGIRRAQAPDTAPYFRGAVQFTAPAGPLQWLNDSVFVSTGYREGGTIHLEVLEVL